MGGEFRGQYGMDRIGGEGEAECRARGSR